MSLPKDHKCDVNCDFDDADHKRLRNKLTSIAVSKADQAWANLDKDLEQLMITTEKLFKGEQLSSVEAKLIDRALSLVMGELCFRRAKRLMNDFTL